MPSIKKAVYGIFRQLSSNSVAPSSNNGHISDDLSEEPSLSGPSTLNKTVYENNNENSKFQTISEINDDTLCPSHFPGEPLFLNGTYPRTYHEKLCNLAKSQISPRYFFLSNEPYFQSENGFRSTIEMEQSFIHMYLSGRLKKPRQPEIYSGKTGVDLPIFQIVPFNPNVFASYSGPDGGLTQVPCVTRRPLANIANLDDELNLSYDADLDALSALTSKGIFPSPQAIRRVLVNNSQPPHRTQSLNSNGELDALPVCYETKYDWSQWHDRAYGLCTSLYECHPFTGVHAGTPIADVFAICARRNNCVLALADGVNWGEKSRLAARCAIRGAIEHLQDTLYNTNTPVRNTLDIFHALLGAFHTGHQLILQETGSLTTLCVAVVCQLKGHSQWVVCACNVGDSLAFVYSEKYGVREITLGSHDIQQMRDMRDAGGALGPVDGVNPELHNMTCSMTTVDVGDIVFITSDGVSDNFDPVVGKFCVIRDPNSRQERPLQNHKEAHSDGESAQNSVSKSPSLGGRKAGSTASKKEKSTEQSEAANGLKTDSHLPVVEAYQRHELMLLRMEDLLRHGVTIGDSSTRTARDLCENLINFATQLTTAKRRILEDPELYQGENGLAQRDQRLRRRQVRQRIAEMPGKLDHATVVAYMVGEKPITPTASVIMQEDVYDDKDNSISTVPQEYKQSQHEIDVEIDTTDDSMLDTPNTVRRLTPSSKIEHIFSSVVSTPTSPTIDDSDMTLCPPLPTQPVPYSSSSDEETEWSAALEKGPFEPPAGSFLPVDESIMDLESANRLKMMDEKSISSFSGCPNTPLPPEDIVDQARHEGTRHELATPAQDAPSLLSTVQSQGCVLDTLNDNRGMKEITIPEVHEKETQIHQESSIVIQTEGANHAIEEPCENQLRNDNTDYKRPSIPQSLPLENRTINADLHSNSTENTYEAFGSISISSVLECCDLIIKDTDTDVVDENTRSYGYPHRQSYDHLDKREPLTPLDENDVVEIFTTHGIPLISRRWPPSTNRMTNKCASLPPGTSLESIKPNMNPDRSSTIPDHGPRRFSDTRSQRSIMNESYYMATLSDDVGTSPETKPSTTGNVEKGEMKSGRFGKLSKAIDRLERVIPGRRKHRRGSPTRHTVATDGSQWAEMKEKPIDTSRSAKSATQNVDVSASPTKRIGTSAMHLNWSPVRAFRALTSPRRHSSSTKNLEKKSEVDAIKNGDGLRNSLEKKLKPKRFELKTNIVDTTADVIIQNTEVENNEKVTYVMQHSASDTEIVTCTIKDNGKESDV